MRAVHQIDQKTGDIARLLLNHYDVNARDLPWRKRPGQGPAEPYHVWLSEIMLQQTTVAAVIPFYHRFVSRWPDFAALAKAHEADVLAAWAGLGYYARARNLHNCARQVVAEYDGRLPANEVGLRALPGVGSYTAAAIAAIAFNQRAVVVDANIERVVARLFAISTPLPAAKPQIFLATDAITPESRSGDFAQAMMDLGAGLCSVKDPSCTLCPVNTHCAAFKSGSPGAYPLKAPKKPKPSRCGTVFWIEKGQAVWLVRRAGNGMLASMRALPDDGWSARADGNNVAPALAEWRELETRIGHQFTHFSLVVKIAVTAWPTDAPDPGTGEWWPVNSLDKAGLPTLFNKVAKAAIASGE